MTRSLRAVIARIKLTFVNFITLFTARDCKTHGHRYAQRYDELIDLRLTGDQIHELVRWADKKPPRIYLYVRDICEMCGDVIDRTEGEHPLKVLARQAR